MSQTYLAKAELRKEKVKLFLAFLAAIIGGFLMLWSIDELAQIYRGLIIAIPLSIWSWWRKYNQIKLMEVWFIFFLTSFVAGFFSTSPLGTFPFLVGTSILFPMTYLMILLALEIWRERSKENLEKR